MRVHVQAMTPASTGLRGVGTWLMTATSSSLMMKAITGDRVAGVRTPFVMPVLQHGRVRGGAGTRRQRQAVGTM